MRPGPFVQALVMHQYRSWTERHRSAIAERPFAAIAISCPDITIDIEATLVVRPIGPGSMDQVGAPSGEVAGLKLEVDRVGCRKTDGFQRRILHRHAKRVLL